MEKKNYIKVMLGGRLINIEVTNSIPDGYVLFDYHEEYAIYCKEEVISEDTHHYFLAVNYII